MSFGEAFKAARKAGKKEFTYKGKRYHTRTADEEKAAKAKPKPKPKAAPKKDMSDKAVAARTKAASEKVKNEMPRSLRAKDQAWGNPQSVGTKQPNADLSRRIGEKTKETAKSRGSSSPAGKRPKVDTKTKPVRSKSPANNANRGKKRRGRLWSLFN